jgi:hypothetical protein
LSSRLVVCNCVPVPDGKKLQSWQFYRGIDRLSWGQRPLPFEIFTPKSDLEAQNAPRARVGDYSYSKIEAVYFNDLEFDEATKNLTDLFIRQVGHDRHPEAPLYTGFDIVVGLVIVKCWPRIYGITLARVGFS